MYAITVVLLITMQLMFINLIVHRICDYEYKAVRCILVNVISVVVLSDAIIIDKGLWCLIAANVLVFVIFAFAMSAKAVWEQPIPKIVILNIIRQIFYIL